VKLFVLPAARTDIRGQYEYYLERDLPEIGDRFVVAVDAAIEATLRMPKAGAPKHVRNPQLAGLRS
jgi:plasmid stabilization system protein ParE